MLLHHIYTWQKTLKLQQALNVHFKKFTHFLQDDCFLDVFHISPLLQKI
jgi:hypothetical protein